MHFDNLDIEIRQRLGASRTSAASRLTPRLILPDLTITAWTCRRFQPRRSSSPKAGRADDSDDRACAASSGDRRRSPAGAVKSSTASERRQRGKSIVAHADSIWL
jgi:hypothetical protein